MFINVGQFKTRAALSSFCLYLLFQSSVPFYNVIIILVRASNKLGGGETWLDKVNSLALQGCAPGA